MFGTNSYFEIFLPYSSLPLPSPFAHVCYCILKIIWRFSHGGSVPPRDPPTIKSEEESINDEDESEEEEEEEEDDIQFRPKQSTIIGFRTINALSTGLDLKEKYKCHEF